VSVGDHCAIKLDPQNQSTCVGLLIYFMHLTNPRYMEHVKMNNKCERLLKEVFVSECEVLCRSLSGGTKENHIISYDNQYLRLEPAE